MAKGVTRSKIDIYHVADRLWETADELRANSHLKAGDYSIPVLGLIFLKFADSRFSESPLENRRCCRMGRIRSFLGGRGVSLM